MTKAEEFKAMSELVFTYKELLREACESVEQQANWDKPPYSKWYYRAMNLIKNGAMPL